MDPVENASLERRSSPPSPIGRRISVFLGISAFLGILQSLLAIFLPRGGLPALPWFVPAIEAFCLGGSLSIAFLCLGRYLFRKEPYALVVGLAFWYSSLFNLAYLLAREGVFADLQSTPTYFFYLLYLALLLAFLFSPMEAKSPPRISTSGLWTIFGYNTLFCLMVIVGLTSLENHLPPLSLEMRTTFFSRSLPYAFFFLYLAAICAQWRRLKWSREPLVRYFFSFLVVSLWVFPGMIQSQGPYDIAWYSYHLIRAFSYTAVYLALLLEYFDLYRELGGTVERMALTHRLNALVAGSLNLEEIYRTSSREIQRLISYDRLAISLLQKHQNSATVFAEESRLPAPVIPPGIPASTEGTATGWVIDHREPLICEDVLQDSRFPITHKRYQAVGLRSYVNLPLFAKGKVLGVLNLGSRTPARYGPKEVETLSPLAEILSIAIENSNLYQESQRLLKEQSALREIFTQINLLDVGHLLHQLTEQALTLLHADHSIVRLPGPDGILRAVSLAGKGVERVRDRLDEFGKGRSTWIMENQRPLAIRDINQDKLFGPASLLQEMGVRAYLGVPLISRGMKSIGVFTVSTLAEREFTQEEIALAQQLANGAAIAIENARLFEEVQRKSQELEEAFKTKSDLLNIMAHELRTPLNVLIATLQIFTEGFYGELSEKQLKGFEPMQRNAMNLLNLISSILDFARLEAKRVPLQIEDFSLKEITDELESSLLPLAKEKGLELRFKVEEATLKLKSDKSKVKTILQNLLGNAVKYTDRGEVELRVSARPGHRGDRSEEASVSIAVKDTGIGIKEADLPHIFEAFYMAEGINRRIYPGSGLGLSIVKRLLELLHGDIRVQSEWGKGSTFTATLPLVHPTES